MLIVGVVTLLIVGPKDLPKVMRTMGSFMARIRMMGQEFKDAFDDMDADDEIKELRAEIAQMKSLGYLDDDLEDDIRDLNTELRDATDMSSDKT